MPASREDRLTAAEAIRWRRIGTLSALAMLLGYLESFLPIPLPGVKLGLANIPILVSLAQGDLVGALFVGLVKVAATSLLFGNPVTLAYSLTGTLLAFLLMAPLSRLRTMRLEMVSVVGALAHETGQLLVAQLLLGTQLVWYSAPVLAIAGCATGLLCGVAAQRLVVLAAQGHGASEPPGQGDGAGTLPHPSADDVPSPPAEADTSLASIHAEETGDGTTSRLSDGTSVGTTRRAGLLLLAFVAFVALVMHLQAPVPLLLCLTGSVALCIAGRMGAAQLLTSLAPTLPIALMTLVAQVVANQQGEPLAVIGPLMVSRQAARASAVMLARLACITWASVGIVRLTGTGSLTDCARAMLWPLRRLGVRTAGPELALSTTMSLIPLVAERVQTVGAQGHTLASPSFWTTEVPRLAAELLDVTSQARPSA